MMSTHEFPDHCDEKCIQWKHCTSWKTCPIRLQDKAKLENAEREERIKKALLGEED